MTLVSSAAMRPTSDRMRSALRVMSSRLPMGVATTYRVGIGRYSKLWKGSTTEDTESTE